MDKPGAREEESNGREGVVIDDGVTRTQVMGEYGEKYIHPRLPPLPVTPLSPSKVFIDLLNAV